jgi:hypothetical protein
MQSFFKVKKLVQFKLFCIKKNVILNFFTLGLRKNYIILNIKKFIKVFKDVLNILYSLLKKKSYVLCYFKVFDNTVANEIYRTLNNSFSFFKIRLFNK